METIIEKILADARTEAGKIVQESREKADKIREAARAEASELARSVIQEAERRGNLEASRLLTQARLESRLKILSLKKTLVDEVLDKAIQKKGLEAKKLKRKVILKDGEREEAYDLSRLREELRAKLEKFILEALGI